MDAPRIINHKSGPEAIIQRQITDFLILRGWIVKPTHGNLHQKGFPDLFICHVRYGMRWVEVKNAKSYSFTAAQLEEFPILCANGSPIWILTAATEDEYKKLWQPPNWHTYLMLLHHQTSAHHL